jgi:hypothetical protein
MAFDTPVRSPALAQEPLVRVSMPWLYRRRGLGQQQGRFSRFQFGGTCHAESGEAHHVEPWVFKPLSMIVKELACFPRVPEIFALSSWSSTLKQQH